MMRLNRGSSNPALEDCSPAGFSALPVGKKCFLREGGVQGESVAFWVGQKSEPPGLSQDTERERRCGRRDESADPGEIPPRKGVFLDASLTFDLFSISVQTCRHPQKHRSARAPPAADSPAVSPPQGPVAQFTAPSTTASDHLPLPDARRPSRWKQEGPVAPWKCRIHTRERVKGRSGVGPVDR